MSTLTTAMAWEYWNQGRIRILSAWLGVACMNALYYRLATLSADTLPEEAQLVLFLATCFTNIALIVFLLLRSTSGARDLAKLDSRAFLLPLPTWSLVLWRMLFPITAAALLWIGVSLLTLAITPNGATGETWPLLGPALVAAILTAWGLALRWLPLHPKPLKSLASIVFLAGPIAWTLTRFGATSNQQARLWTSVTLAEIGAAIAFLLGAYAVAVFGTSRARRGGALGISNLGEILEAILVRRRRGATGAFRSPGSAQVWLEWRQKGWMIPLYAAAGLTTMALLVGSTKDTQIVFPVLSKLFLFMLVAAPPMVGCLMGRFSQSSAEAAIDGFRASRPLSDAALASSILRVGGLSLAATWAAAILTIAAILGGLDLVEGGGSHLQLAWQTVEKIVQNAGWADATFGLLAFLVISWTNMALVATIFLAGRNSVVAGLFLTPYALGIAVLIFQRTISPETLVLLASVGSWSLGSGALVLTAWAFFAARRRRMITARLLAICAGLWLVGLVLLAWRSADRLRTIFDSGGAFELSVLVMGPGILALALAPMALAPIALAWNRHR